MKIEYRAFNKIKNKYEKSGSVLLGSECEPFSLIPHGGGKYSVQLSQECKIEQFTGLTDKNGIKVFENDIIEFQNTEGEGLIKKVWYCDKMHSIMIGNLRYSTITESGFFQPSQLIFEVIGNFNDNPELLK